MYRVPFLLSIFCYTLLHVVRAQRGGYRGSGWQGVSEIDEASVGDEIQQIITETQTQVQLQTRTMISTATAIATAISQSMVHIQVPTTIMQATTVISVRTAILSPSSSSSPTVPTSSEPISSDIGGLTVNVNLSSSIPIPSTYVQSSSTSPTTQMGAASEVSAPVTSLNGTVPSLLSGMDLKTTGVPNLGNGRGDQSVVYGHTTSGGGTRRSGKSSGTLGVVLGLSTLLMVAPF